MTESLKSVRQMSHNELVDEIVRRKVAIRMEDAESCTSHEEEYDQLIRYGCPDLTKYSVEDLREMVEGYREAEAEEMANAENED